jgi:hypothetical protein
MSRLLKGINDRMFLLGDPLAGVVSAADGRPTGTPLEPGRA